MSTLSNSIFSCIYSIPYLNNDSEMVNNFTILFFVVTILLTLKSIRTPLAYGRHDTKLKSTWIPTLKSRTVWVLCFAPIPIIALLIVLTTPSKKLGNPYNLLALISFTIHYINRFLYTLKISENAKPVGLLIVLVFSGAAINAFVQCHDLANVHESTPSSLAYIGILFVITGLSINIYHDNILLNLRKPTANSKSKNESKESSGYKIPHGGLFEYISCANYFGEIVEWIGFALISRGPLQFAFAMWSASFLGIRALQHHEFYVKTFSGKYPLNRKAIIPFII